MKPRLVFVHGVGPVRDVAAELATWTATLAAGARRAGHPRFAAALTTATDTFFAHYADLFRRPGAQGGPVVRPDDEEAAFALAVLTEAIAVQLEHERTPDERKILEQAAARVAPTDPPQGVGAVARRAIDVATTLTDVAYLRRAGQWVSGSGLVGHVSQVGRYLDRRPLDPAAPSGGTLDVAVRARVHELVGDGPAVVVAHSLGTVVALEALHESGAEVPLLVTLGSPLAMRAIVRPRVRPQPPSVPAGVGRWLNVWDRDDLVAARPLLERHLAPNAARVRPVSERVDSDGSWVHPALKYLAHPGTAGPIAEVMAAVAH
jgi:hypothetical protein